MAGFISSADEADFQSAMGLLHATYAKPVTIYQTEQQVVVSTDPGYNFIYNTSPNSSDVINVIQSGVYNMRIHYPRHFDSKNLKSIGGIGMNDQINMQKKEYLVKLIVDSGAKEILQSCNKVMFNEVFYQMQSDPKPHGTVGYQFYNFYLSAVN